MLNCVKLAAAPSGFRAGAQVSWRCQSCLSPALWRLALQFHHQHKLALLPKEAAPAPLAPGLLIPPPTPSAGTGICATTEPPDQHSNAQGRPSGSADAKLQHHPTPAERLPGATSRTRPSSCLQKAENPQPEVQSPQTVTACRERMEQLKMYAPCSAAGRGCTKI